MELLSYINEMQIILETKVTSSKDMKQLLKNQFEIMGEMDYRIGEYLNNHGSKIYNTLLVDLHLNDFVTFRQMLEVIEIALVNYFKNKI